MAKLTVYLQNYIKEKGLSAASNDFRISVELLDRNGDHVSETQLLLPGYTQQEDILDALTDQGVLSPMAEYYFLNWPKSLKLLLCELGKPDEAISLKLMEAQLCSCPE